MIRFVVLIAVIMCASPSFARDDGGFGSGFSQKAPTAFSDPAPEALAKYQDPLNPAAIEPASGDAQDVKDPAVKKEDAQKDVPSAPLNNPKE